MTATDALDVIETTRLRLRRWRPEDAEGALAIYGDERIASWLAPAMRRVADVDEMKAVLETWAAAGTDSGRPIGRWAVESRETGQIVGAAVLQPLPPDHDDLEIGWQVSPEAWGNGYGAEAGRALARHAFDNGEDELFVVARPRNIHAVRTAEQMRMEWVGETEKYYDLRLQVYRMRKADLD